MLNIGSGVWKKPVTQINIGSSVWKVATAYINIGNGVWKECDVTEKIQVSVTVAAKSKVYGAADPALTYTAVGFVDGDTFGGALYRDAGSSVGSYQIRTDGLTYNSTKYTVSFNVAYLTITKATPSIISSPTAGNITYGQYLSSSTLTGGSGSVAGTFRWTNTATQPDVGTSSQGITFDPTDSTNYDSTTGSASIYVGKATPTVYTYPTTNAITYGTVLSSVGWASTGSASVGGTFGWTGGGAGIYPTCPSYSANVTFSPSDSTRYNPVTFNITLTVNKRNPTVNSLPTAGSIYVNQTLSTSVFSGGDVDGYSGANLAGYWAFVNSGTSFSTAQTRSEQVYWVSTDSTNYNTPYTAGSVSITIQAIPAVVPNQITWPGVSGSAVYGARLDSVALSGGIAKHNGVTVNGTFAYKFPSNIWGTVGTVTFTTTEITFTPQDTTTYLPTTGYGTGNVTITKATATVTLSGLSQAYNGTQRVVTATTNPAGKSVTITYAGSSTPPTNAGSYAISATINDTYYQGSTSGTLTVSKIDQSNAVVISPSGTTTKSSGQSQAYSTEGGNGTGGFTWSTSNSAIASLSSTTGTSITVTAGNTTGTATISVTRNGDTNYNSKGPVTASFTTTNQDTGSITRTTPGQSSHYCSSNVTITLSSLTGAGGGAGDGYSGGGDGGSSTIDISGQGTVATATGGQGAYGDSQSGEGAPGGNGTGSSSFSGSTTGSLGGLGGTYVDAGGRGGSVTGGTRTATAGQTITVTVGARGTQTVGGNQPADGSCSISWGA